MPKLQQGYLFNNRYQLLRKIGSGGYSEVWLVSDTHMKGFELVLKIFLPEAQLDDKMVDLFGKEFQLVYNINHPNLLKYGHFDACMGYPYLEMPYYRLGSAEKLIGHCTEDVGWRYLRDVAAGLACLHSKRPAIIHQDIKPANVLLSDDSFIITDFGISASVNSMFKDSNSYKAVLGTRPYMPPEKYLPNPEIYVENDIWSLGASLYELLTGDLPFGSRGGAEQLEKIESPELPATFSNEMRYVVRKCLSYYPSHRLTAKELKSYAETQIEKRKTPPPPPPSNPYTTSGGRQGQIDPLFSSNGSGGSRGYDYPHKPDRNRLSWVLIAAASVVGIAMVVFFTIFLFNHSGRSNPVVVEQQEDTVRHAPPTPDVPVSGKKSSPKGTRTGTNANGGRGGTVDVLQYDNPAEEEASDDVFSDQHKYKTTFVSSSMGGNNKD